MTRPDVSVIIGVYNAMPYLIRCVSSVLAQTIGLDRIEVIAIDDGSTDGSGSQLDLFAASYPVIRVVHQQNSGGPARPRNVGLSHATGRYVFFLDSDDYLGEEALERMVAVADENGSEVVLGRMVAVGSREVPTSMFKKNEPQADLFGSRVYRTLRSQRLFSRDMIERARIRFPEPLILGDDQSFCAEAYFNAKVISVVADYDCYYLVAREDGKNITATTAHDIRHRLNYIEYMMNDVVARYFEPGDKRDFLMLRHFYPDLAKLCFSRRFLTQSRAIQEEVVARARKLVEDYYTPGMAAQLSARVRARHELIRRGLLDDLIEFVRIDVGDERPADIVDKGRVYAAFPQFRNPAAGLPDECFDVTDELKARHHLDKVAWKGTEVHLHGHAFIDHVSTVDQRVTVVLRERTSRAEYRVGAHATPTPELTSEHGNGHYDYSMAGFQAKVDVARIAGGQPLPTGRWDLFLTVASQGVTKDVRIGRDRADSIDSSPRPRVVPTSHGPGTVLIPYFTKPHDNLTLDVGENVHRFEPKLRIDRVVWASHGPAALLVTGRVDLGRKGELPKAKVNLLLREATPSTPEGSAHRVRASVEPGTGNRGFIAVLPLASALTGRPLPYGDWTVEVEFEVAGRSYRTAVPTPAKPTIVRWSRSGRPATAAITSGPGEAPLGLRLAPLPPRAIARRAIGAVRRRLHS